MPHYKLCARIAAGSAHSNCELPESFLSYPAELPNLRWTKLNRPRIAGDVVRRARVRESLERFLHRPLTLVCAPAGYGKTTLLSFAPFWVCCRLPYWCKLQKNAVAACCCRQFRAPGGYRY